MSIASDTKAWIRRGQEGGNKGLSLGLPRLQKFLPGFQKSTTYSLGGESGSGKSKLAAQMFIYSPYEQLVEQGLAHRLRVLLFSLEIEKRQVIVNAAINRLYRKYNLLTDIDMVLSRGENRCSQELYDAVVEQLDYYEQLEDVLIINDVGMGPTGINKAVLSYMRAHGTEHKKVVNNGEGDFEIFSHYTPNDPEVLVSPQVDHAGLVKGERDAAKGKQAIDKLSSDYGIGWRNNYGCSPLFVQQLNRTLSSADRAKIDRVRPQLSDFKETANIQEDANVVLALFSPNRYQIAMYEGYDITQLKDRFRSLHILKNRDGQADKMLGVRFLGECGDFQELPIAKDMSIPGSYARALQP